jgi:hypothetical protein
MKIDGVKRDNTKGISDKKDIFFLADHQFVVLT